MSEDRVFRIKTERSSATTDTRTSHNISNIEIERDAIKVTVRLDPEHFKFPLQN